MVTFEYFQTVVDRLVSESDLLVEKEHDLIYEFFDAEVPLFKLIFAPALVETDGGAILLAYQVEVEPPVAVMWFLRLNELLQGTDPTTLKLTGAYIKDELGNVHVGADASIVRYQKIERAVINAIKREAAKKRAAKEHKPVVNVTATADLESAVAAFDQWDPKSKRSN